MKCAKLVHSTSLGDIDEIILSSNELELHFLNYGATLCGVFHYKNPDRNMVLRYQGIEDYIEDPAYLGHSIAPVAGRINRASFNLHGIFYQLIPNSGEHLLHSGQYGMSRQILPYHLDETKESVSVTFVFTQISSSGFPGDYHLYITYQLFEGGHFRVDYRAQGVGICNPTSHCYFNLGEEGTIRNHQLFAPVTSYYHQRGMINTGQVISNDARFDFTKYRLLSEVIDSLKNEEEIGLDHTLILNSSEPIRLQVGEVSLSVTTSYPCVHCYTANYENYRQLVGEREFRYGGITLECQYPNNDINLHPDTSKIILPSGGEYHEWIDYRLQGL